jgi:hypothetical protein
MPITADANGQAVGQFSIPAGIPEGTKRFNIVGDSGSEGEATYTGASIIPTVTRQITAVRGRNDPLAQTFTLQESRFIGGVDLWFTAKGTKRVVVQIRTANLGMPTQTVLTSATVEANALSLTDYTRLAFHPFWAEAGVEYALVVLTDDPTHALAISELGKIDTTTGKYVTAQAYQVGVLLSSSNASTWTAHQDKDLTFRLLATTFSQAQTDVVLQAGLTASDLTDVMILANVDRPATGTDVEFILVDSVGNEYKLSEDLPLSLKDKITGMLTLKARLKGTQIASPIVYPSIQAPFGTVAAIGDYITRSIPTPGAEKLTVTFDASTPGTSSVSVYYQNYTDWVPIALSGGLQLDSNLVEMTYTAAPYELGSTRVKIVLNGTILYRPRVKNLRVIAV